MPELIAIFSDVHSNIEALHAVVADMEHLNIHRRYCLGDVVGYGPDPSACLDLVRDMGCPVLKGNHESAVGSTNFQQEMEAEEMNTSALAGIELSRKVLSVEQCNWLRQLPLTLKEENVEFVHGSLDAPGEWWYVLSPDDARLHFEAQTRPLCFCGHTHNPMVWHLDGSRLSVRPGVGRIPVSERGKTLINVGSVGQPRDLNSDACYAVYSPEGKWVQFRRVRYDLNKTKRKIKEAGLPNYTAKRLSEGR